MRILWTVSMHIIYVCVREAHYLGKKNKQGKLEHIEDNGFISKKINKN